MGIVLGHASPQGVLRRHKQRLEDMIESRFELTGQLATSDVIGFREISELRAISSVYQRNAALLDLIAKKPQTVYEQFLTALELTGQKHVANFITNNGVLEPSRTTDDENWPLEQSVLSRIYHNLLFLEETIDTDGGLVADLFARGIVTRQQFDYIKESRPSQRAAELVNILTRRSFAHLRLFVECMYANGQSHVARVLEHGGVVIAIELQLELPADSDMTASTAQTDIVHRVQQQCRSSPDERYRIKAFGDLAHWGVEVLDAKPGSVRLYLWCRSADALVAHRRLCDNGNLKTIVETWFADILQSPVAVRLTERPTSDLAHLSCGERCSSVGISSRSQPATNQVRRLLEPSLFKNLYSLNGVGVEGNQSIAAANESRPVTTPSDFVCVPNEFDRPVSCSSCQSGAESLVLSGTFRKDKGFFSFR